MSSEKVREKYIDKRNQLWPNLSFLGDQNTRFLWEKDRKTGFVNIPRSMPYILNLIDYLAAKNGHKTLRDTYLALWCRDFGTAYVDIQDSSLLAVEAGFSKERAETTLFIKIKALSNEISEKNDVKNLGFIRVQYQNKKPKHILILNPMLVIFIYYKNGEIPKDKYDELYNRCIDVGDKELVNFSKMSDKRLNFYKKLLNESLNSDSEELENIENEGD